MNQSEFMPRTLLWRQSFNFPGAIFLQCVLQPVMKTAWPALPKFNNNRLYDIAAPVWRPL